MDVTDLVVEVRDSTLARRGMIAPQDLNIKVSPVLDGAGGWTIKLPADHAMTAVLETPGSGIIVTGPTDIILSGPVTGIVKAVSSTDPGGTVTFSGVSDTILLADRLAFPQPSNADPTTQALAHDVRSGNAETVMREYVDVNLGPSAPGVRRNTAVALAANQNRGPAVSKSARFDQLSDLITEIAIVANLGFRIVQRGSQLVFEVTDRVDRSAYVRFDIYNGNVSSQEVSIAPPKVTQVIVAGQGDLTDRQFVSVTTSRSVADSATWNRYIEYWLDQRQTAVVSELAQAGSEVLAGSGFTQIDTKVVPTDDTTMQFGYDWNIGDSVTIVVDDVEQRSYVSGVNIVADEKGVRIGLVLGDLAAMNAAVASQRLTDDLEQRVGILEKNTGTYQMTGWATASLINSWANVAGKQSLRYRRVGNGLIEVQGVVKSGAGVIFNLPAGYRPDASIDIPIVASGGAGYVTISPTDGAITPFGTLTGNVSIQIIFGTQIS